MAELRSALQLPVDPKFESDKQLHFPTACAVCVNVDQGVVRVLLLQPNKVRDEWTVPKRRICVTDDAKRRYQLGDAKYRRQVLLTELKNAVLAQTGRRVDDTDIIPGFDRPITLQVPLNVHNPTGFRMQHYFLVA